MCRHEQSQLVGTAEGIRCRACGKVFNSFEELEREREPVSENREPVSEKPKNRRKKSND